MAWVSECYHSVYKTSDGKVILIPYKKWGDVSLTGADLTAWQADMAEIEAYEQGLRDSGDWVQEDITETVTISDNTYNVQVGVKVTFPNLTEAPTWHAKYTDNGTQNWADMMNADENFTFVKNYTYEVSE